MSLYTELKIKSDVKNNQWLETLPFYEKITKALTENGFYSNSQEKLTAVNLRVGSHVDCIIADVFLMGSFIQIQKQIYLKKLRNQKNYY